MEAQPRHAAGQRLDVEIRGLGLGGEVMFERVEKLFAALDVDAP
ncbi:MAG: hypothetical protein WAU77_11125 [Solirubrobacteraceae bacterium]